MTRRPSDLASHGVTLSKPKAAHVALFQFLFLGKTLYFDPFLVAFTVSESMKTVALCEFWFDFVLWCFVWSLIFVPMEFVFVFGFWVPLFLFISLNCVVF